MHKIKVEHNFPILKTIYITLFCFFLLIIGISLGDYYYSKTANKHSEEVSYTQFLKQVNEQKVARVIIDRNKMIGALKDGQIISTNIPISTEFIETLKKNNVEFQF
ncbi:MAG TPA: hypothetical protein DCM73_14975 [Clostridiales bacterium]|nr:hypothetical protein [Clostridiales bacterium]